MQAKHIVTAPLVAVVIPAYKQPDYLKDAVISAVRQTIRDDVRIVIVNDGCPFPSTDHTARFLRVAFPETVRYLRKPNGGLSSARNHGVRFALAAWPSVQAVFPLDADNQLSPETLATLWHTLSQAPEDVGWIYQDLSYFGSDSGGRHVGVPFNLYRLIHQNYCDAGSLIRREVFEAGIWYDERMRIGFEDWEFFVSAGLSGFRAQHLSDTGFLYRRHGHSMLSDALRKHSEIHEFILRKHESRLRPNDLTRLEHQCQPRFAVILVDKGTAYSATDPSSGDRTEMPVASFIDTVNTSLREPWPRKTYIPPIVIFAKSSVLDSLNSLHVLPGAVYAMQRALHRVDYALLSLDVAAEPHRLELMASHRSGEPALIAIRTRRWLELQETCGGQAAILFPKLRLNAEQLTLFVGDSHWDAAAPDSPGGRPRHIVEDRRSTDDETDPDGDISSESDRHGVRLPRSGRLEDGALNVLHRIQNASPARAEVALGLNGVAISPHAVFADWDQIERGRSSFPCCVHPAGEKVVNVVWAAPWLTLDGVDRCTLHLAGALAHSRSDVRLHLVVTTANVIEADPTLLSAFSTVTFLPAEEDERLQVLGDVLVSADVVINAHSLAAYELLPELKDRSRAVWMSYLHVIDPDEDGRPAGYPVLATRQYGDLIDHFLVISQQLRSWCSNMGIPREKIVLVPNAPTIFPSTRAEALAIAAEKEERTYSVDHPLRILFSGRFDRQKGFDRLERIAAGLEERGVPFSMTLLGKKVLNRQSPSRNIPGARVLPATTDPQELARRYREADVLLLPSRWEGVPLAMLEGMAFGASIVATNVGAVGEVVQNGKNGFLLDPDQPEPVLSAAACDILAVLADRPRDFDHVRRDAVQTVMDLSWKRSASILAALIA